MKPTSRRRVKNKSLKFSMFILSVIFVTSIVTSILMSFAISAVIRHFDTFKQSIIFTSNTVFGFIYSALWVLPLLIVATTVWLCRIGYLFTLHIESMRDVIDD